MAGIRFAVIQCDKEFYIKLCTILQGSITGQPILYSDSLVDLVRRRCPEIYEIAENEGFRFVPSDRKYELTEKPPAIWFDILRKEPKQCDYEALS